MYEDFGTMYEVFVIYRIIWGTPGDGMFYPLVIFLHGHGPPTKWRTFQPDMFEYRRVLYMKEMVEPSEHILCNTVYIYYELYISYIIF